jgi:hypothetical protein
MQVYWNVVTYQWKVYNGKIENLLFRKISLLTGPHCQFLGVVQHFPNDTIYF